MSATSPRPTSKQQDRVDIYKDVASVTVATSIKLAKWPNNHVRLQSVTYDNPTGFAGNASNYWTIALTDGVHTLASWSTNTAAQGTLGADTPVQLVLAGGTPGPDLTAGSSLILTLTPTGAPAALPAGQLHVDGFAL